MLDVDLVYVADVVGLDLEGVGGALSKGALDRRRHRRRLQTHTRRALIPLAKQCDKST